MNARDVLANGAIELAKPPSEYAIPARLAEIESALEQFGSSAKDAREVLSFFWNDITDGDVRSELIVELRRLATR